MLIPIGFLVLLVLFAITLAWSVKWLLKIALWTVKAIWKGVWWLLVTAAEDLAKLLNVLFFKFY